MPPGAAAQLDTFARRIGWRPRGAARTRPWYPPDDPHQRRAGACAERARARRSAVPVEVALRIEGRLPEPVEVAAYYVVSEALTNATKHAHATVISVEADAEAEVLRIASLRRRHRGR